jgi:poly(3-hydroxybutyrate) depolymerase
MRFVSGFVLALYVCLGTSVTAADRLPAYKGDSQGTSVSGLSSGAFMAVQYQVAFSASVKGAGVVAGGPYYCAAGIALNASICMGHVANRPPVPTLMVAAARLFALSGRIDALDHLKGHRVYVFSGTNDQVVRQPAVDAAVAFYKLAGVGHGAIKYVNTVPAGHGFITPAYGGECGTNASPWLNHCLVDGVGLDQAGAIFNQIYGALNAPATALTGKIVAFDQKEFASNAARMADEAYAYVPESCASGTPCRLHIAFHGCAQSAKVVGDRFYANAGYNRWADTNNIIVLYPQVNSSLPNNPQGCWDWFGYTGGSYPTKTGPQLAAVKAMADRLLGGQ